MVDVARLARTSDGVGPRDAGSPSGARGGDSPSGSRQLTRHPDRRAMSRCSMWARRTPLARHTAVAALLLTRTLSRIAEAELPRPDRHHQAARSPLAQPGGASICRLTIRWETALARTVPPIRDPAGSSRPACVSWTIPPDSRSVGRRPRAVGPRRSGPTVRCGS